MKNFFWVLGIALILGAVVCLVLFLRIYGTTGENEKVIDAIQTNSIDSCRELKNDTDKTNCISSIAFKQADVTICEELTNINLSNPYGGPGLNGKDICLAAVAEVILDIKLCRQVNNIELRDNCFYFHA